MNEQDGFDTRLAAHFDREHRQVPADDFVATTMRSVRAGRRRKEVTRAGVLVAALFAALVVAMIVSPWLIPGVARVNWALESSCTWAMGQPVAWALGAVVFLVVLALRLRRR